QELLQHARLDVAFQAFYDSHAGPQLLGPPISPAIPTQEGLIQYFRAGALLLPAATPLSVQSAAAQAAAFDLGGGVEWLPLLDVLLRLGSQAPVSGDASSLTYLDLRRAVITAHTRTPLLSNQPGQLDVGTSQRVSESSAVGLHVSHGHVIPAAVWEY